VPAEGVLFNSEEFGLMEKLVGNAGKEVAHSHARFKDAPPANPRRFAATHIWSTTSMAV